MASERSDHSLQAMGLVHEAYLRLMDVESLGRSLRSIEREWRYARSWLHREISEKNTPAT